MKSVFQMVRARDGFRSEPFAREVSELASYLRSCVDHYMKSVPFAFALFDSLSMEVDLDVVNRFNPMHDFVLVLVDDVDSPHGAISRSPLVNVGTFLHVFSKKGD